MKEDDVKEGDRTGHPMQQQKPRHHGHYLMMDVPVRKVPMRSLEKK